MTRKFMLLLVVTAVLLSFGSFAYSASLYVDAAPNKYGSPNYEPWWNNAWQVQVPGLLSIWQIATVL